MKNRRTLHNNTLPNNWEIICAIFNLILKKRNIFFSYFVYTFWSFVFSKKKSYFSQINWKILILRNIHIILCYRNKLKKKKQSFFLGLGKSKLKILNRIKENIDVCLIFFTAQLNFFVSSDLQKKYIYK